MQHYPTQYFLRQLAGEAGRVMLKHFGLGREWTLKDDMTPLTRADTEINALVLRTFERSFPHIHVVGEEGSREVADAEYSVLCDPVDGTSPYSLGIPVSAFCLTVLKADEPLIGIIHDPFLNRTWVGEKGKGSTLNGASVRVSEYRWLKTSNLMLVKWQGCGFNLDWVEQKLMEQGAKVQNITSLAYFGGLIAAGTVEASIFPGSGLLETAAMQLVVEGAGGRVTNFKGDRIRYSREQNYTHRLGSLVSNGRIHDKLLDSPTPRLFPSNALRGQNQLLPALFLFYFAMLRLMPLTELFEQGKINSLGLPERVITAHLSKLYVFGTRIFKVYKHEAYFFADLRKQDVRKQFIAEDFWWNNAAAPEIYQHLWGIEAKEGSFTLVPIHKERTLL